MAKRIRGYAYSGKKVVTKLAIKEGRIPKNLKTASGKPTTIGKVLELKAYKTAVSPAIRDRIAYLENRKMDAQARSFLRFASKHQVSAERFAANVQQMAAHRGSPQNRQLFQSLDLEDFDDMAIDDEWFYY